VSESDIAYKPVETRIPYAVEKQVYDTIAQAYADQSTGDTTFAPEAQRLSLIYAEAGIISNMTIVDYSEADGIGIDTNGDNVADDYLSRGEFECNVDVSADGMRIDSETGSIVKDDGDKKTVISEEGNISTFDSAGRLVNQKTLQQLPSVENGQSSTVAYEEIDFDWDGGILPWDGPTATVTDINGKKHEHLLERAENDYYLYNNDTGSGRFLHPDGRLRSVHDKDLQFAIPDAGGVFVSAGDRMLDRVEDPNNSMDIGIDQPSVYSEPIRGYVVNADNSITVTHWDGATEQIG
jgi:hypothetical protein